jgi:hypothetical protein
VDDPRDPRDPRPERGDDPRDPRDLAGPGPGRGHEPRVWTPPDAGASRDAAVGRDPQPWAGGSGGVGVGEVPDGPPPPPWERERRTRRKWILGLAIAIVLAIPVGLAVASALSTGTNDTPDEQAEGTRPTPDEPGGDGDGDADVDRPLDAPDLDLLEGPDAVFAQLLIDIDASEQAMLGFQRELSEIFRGQAFEDVDELLGALSEAGADGADQLEAARDALEEPVGDVRAETVREVYLEHVDSWVRYMRAVEAEPTIIGSDQDGTARFTLSINATADAFARALEDQLPDDADPEVQRMAEQLLDRGFRPQGDADV